MNKVVSIANSARRNLAAMFPNVFASFGSGKHDHYADFGWPAALSFDHFYMMYRRNGLAAGAIDKTITKTWQEYPNLWEQAKPTQSELEKRVNRHLESIRFWQMFAQADLRSMVGEYGALILRVRDGRRFDQPIGQLKGIEDLVEVIPVWQSQMTVSEWIMDEMSEHYGKPAMFQFNESTMPGQSQTQQPRSLKIHPSRVIILSDDGTITGRSSLEAGYNDLIDAEKIKGAGGEGFWKNAKSAPVLQASAETSLEKMAKAMGVAPSEVADAMNDQVADWQAGFDRMLMLQGMEAKSVSVSLPSPEHFFNIVCQSFAATFNIPIRVLIGNQTGERASTEDAKEWSRACTARRKMRCIPAIRDFLRRMVDSGALSDIDWIIGWVDLMESSSSEKLARAKDMAHVNNSQPSHPVFAVDEIREVAGYAPPEEAIPPITPGTVSGAPREKPEDPNPEE